MMTSSSLSSRREMVWYFERITRMNRQNYCEQEHVVLGNGVVQLADLLHLQCLRTVGLEEQVRLHKDRDEVEALKPQDVGVVVRLDL